MNKDVYRLNVRFDLNSAEEAEAVRFLQSDYAVLELARVPIRSFNLYGQLLQADVL